MRCHIQSFFVQIGILGQIGRFRSPDASPYSRGQEVICRTERGLEIGKVLSDEMADAAEFDGTLVRRVTDDDRMLIRRLQKNRSRAIDQCSEWIRQHQFSAMLLDVEHLFDGESLYFYFLGDVEPELEKLTSELAETYESKVRFRKFTETLLNGCGPDCGTKDCSSDGCSTCALSGGCKSKIKDALNT